MSVVYSPVVPEGSGQNRYGFGHDVLFIFLQRQMQGILLLSPNENYINAGRKTKRLLQTIKHLVLTIYLYGICQRGRERCFHKNE